ESGNPEAQYRLALLYADGLGVARDDAQLESWMRKAAEQDHRRAQVGPRAPSREGRGVGRDEAAALAWYRKAADAGDAVAQNNVGFMYAAGRGAPKSDAE